MHKKHSLPTCAGIALALLLLADASARADASWTYNWSPSTTQVNSVSGGPGYLTLTNEPNGSATGSSNTVITNIQAHSTATSANPANFNNAVTFTLQLTDAASNTSASLPFSGTFTGTITANSSNVQLTFASPTDQKVTLGANTYDVSVSTFTPPGPPGAQNFGSQGAAVTVTLANGNGHTSGTPEPASMTLACLAFPFVGLCAWRKKRRAAV